LKTNDVEADAKALTFLAKVVRRILAAALGGVALLLISPPETTSATAQCSAAWTEVATPLGSNSFYNVGAVGQNDVWAVGSRCDGWVIVRWPNISMHSNGQSSRLQFAEPVARTCVK
jgi:hypothetical protein